MISGDLITLFAFASVGALFSSDAWNYVTFIGGEVKEYTKMLAETREQSLDRMSEEALKLGANAVVNVRFSTSYIMQGAAELLAYGTAVIVEDDT